MLLRPTRLLRHANLVRTWTTPPGNNLMTRPVALGPTYPRTPAPSSSMPNPANLPHHPHPRPPGMSTFMTSRLPTSWLRRRARAWGAMRLVLSPLPLRLTGPCTAGHFVGTPHPTNTHEAWGAPTGDVRQDGCHSSLATPAFETSSTSQTTRVYFQWR